MKKKVLKTLFIIFTLITVFMKNTYAIDSSITVWINGIDKNLGATIIPYQLMSVDVDHFAPKTPTYKWDESVAVWLKENGYESYVDENGYVSETYMHLESDSIEIIELVDAISSAIREGLNIKQMESIVITPYDHISKIDVELPFGSYLFMVTDGVKIYSSCIVNTTFEYKNNEWVINTNDIDLVFKSNMPNITKTVNENTVGITDRVSFTLEVEVPQYSQTMNKTNIVITDQLPIGMDLIEDSLTITSNEIDLTHLFDIQMFEDSFKIVGNTKEFNEYSNLTISYQSKINEHAYTKETLLNQATLTYDVNPYSNEEKLYTIQSEIQLYTYGVKFHLDLEDDTPKTAIFHCSDLKFKKVDNYYVLDENGSKDLQVDENGDIYIKGLDLGNYVLKQVKSSEGYPLPQDSIQFDIIDEDRNGNLDAVSMKYKENRVSNAYVEENQLNFNVHHYKHDFQLPSTGGIGTLIFTLTGIGFILVGLFMKKDEE